MKRLTSDKPVEEMMMFELAHNSCYIKDGKVRYRDYSLDEDARVLTRAPLKKHADGDDAFTSDEDFDNWIAGCLQDGMDSMEGLIALFYRNLWVMADLREALKAYEDTGLSPKQIVEMDGLYAEKCREVAELREGRVRTENGGGCIEMFPCKVGDKLYSPNQYAKMIAVFEVIEICTFKDGTVIIDDLENEWTIEDIGKTVFLTKEAAEKALKEMEDRKNGEIDFC